MPFPSTSSRPVSSSRLPSLVPLTPFVGFRFPALDTPLGTGTVLSPNDLSEVHTPRVRFDPSSLHNSAGRGVFGESEDEVVEGRWSHTPPRLRDALGEEDQLVGLDEEEGENGWVEGGEGLDLVVEGVGGLGVGVGKGVVLGETAGVGADVV